MAMVKKWDADIAGVLATQSDMEKAQVLGRKSIIKNQQNSLQFYLKIISNVPFSFPDSVTVVTCFGEELERWGFVDDTSETDDNRIIKLEEFLHSYILFFKVEMNRNTQSNMEFYIAKNIHIQKKADSYRDGDHLVPIPIFNESISNMKLADFKRALYKQGFVGLNNHISKEKNDSPKYIAWGENNNMVISLYGEFDDFSNAFAGFRFIPEGKIGTLGISEEILNESYVSRDILFLPWKLYSDIEETWSNATLIEPSDIGLDAQKNNDYKEEQRSEMSEEENIEENAFNNEEKFMKRFVQYTEKNGLIYAEVDLYNFHTAIKTGSLVILSGMSGTGKSKLVQEYAGALHLSSDKVIFIPVRPFWQDDADLIGYLDTLNNIYRPGDSGLVNLLIDAERNPDSVYIVCFDEMNLARVEHYFSQFLSVLEMEDGKRFLQLYNEEYENRIHNSHAYPPKIAIGKNVIFVGTVNVDESTHHFSDKVLDRANVISLTVNSFDEYLKIKKLKKQKDDKAQPNVQTKSLTVYYNEFETFINRKEDDLDLNEGELAFFWDLHRLLSKYNKNIGVGWRIIKQIEKYVKNVPKFGPLTKSEAIDIQLVQRVMTKIRGSEEQLNKVLGSYDINEEKVLDSKLQELFDEYKQISDFTKSRECLIDKSRELQLHGHTI
ncbi:McrB family protein [Bacillus toyonensis]|uniref:McrB family protein n=1 Tax=Bacillus toyonensis TaxID=155322 RepID=UPI003D1C75AE